MQLPTIAPYARGPNACVFTMGEIDVYFSYLAPVAFRSPETGLVVHVNVWGPTTGHHLNVIDGGSKLAKGVRVGEDTFATMLSDVMELAR